MTKGIPWDDLPNIYEDSHKNNNNNKNNNMSHVNEAANNKEVKKKAPHVFHLTNDLTSIGKRLAFGVTVSYIIVCYIIVIATDHIKS